MVTKWGLSDRLGTLTYAEDDGEVFLGRQVTQHKQVGDKTRDAIDDEVRSVIDSNYQRAREILEREIDKLQQDGRSADQVRDHRRGPDPRHHMQGRDPQPPADWEDRDVPSSGSKPRERRDDEAPSGRPAPQH